MTQNDKDLLLKDLCARLLFGVKVRYSSYKEFITCTLHSINPVYDNVYLWSENACFSPVSISKIKPYLFPMSSMTEEQKVEFEKMSELDCEYITTQIKNGSPNWTSGLNRVNWLIKNHFDVYGLIPMGLAIDATGLNIY